MKKINTQDSIIIMIDKVKRFYDKFFKLIEANKGRSLDFEFIEEYETFFGEKYTEAYTYKDKLNSGLLDFEKIYKQAEHLCIHCSVFMDKTKKDDPLYIDEEAQDLEWLWHFINSDFEILRKSILEILNNNETKNEIFSLESIEKRQEKEPKKRGRKPGALLDISSLTHRQATYIFEGLILAKAFPLFEKQELARKIEDITGYNTDNTVKYYGQLHYNEDIKIAMEYLKMAIEKLKEKMENSE